MELNVSESLTNSCAFVLVSCLVAVSLGSVLGGVLVLGDRRIQYSSVKPGRIGRALSWLADVSLSVLEGMPVVAMMILVAVLMSDTVSGLPRFGKIALFGSICGVVWCAAFARIVATALAGELKELYSVQMRIWGLGRWNVAVAVMREVWRYALAGAISVAVYAIVVDTGVAYVLRWATVFREGLAVSYYGESFGRLLAVLVYSDKDWLFAGLVAGLAASVCGGLSVVRFLTGERRPRPQRISLEILEGAGVGTVSFVAQCHAPGMSERHFTYGDSDRGVQFQAGDVFMLRGDSGSGKSLLLKALFQSLSRWSSGFRSLPSEVTASARVRMAAGTSSSGIPPIVYLPQEPATCLFQDWDIASYAERCGFQISELTDGGDPYELVTGPSDLTAGEPRQNSAGETRRVALALVSARLRGLRGHHPLILLDEPDASLDSKHSQLLGSQVATLGVHGVTVLVSHQETMREFLAQGVKAGGRRVIQGVMGREQPSSNAGSQSLGYRLRVSEGESAAGGDSVAPSDAESTVNPLKMPARTVEFRAVGVVPSFDEQPGDTPGRGRKAFIRPIPCLDESVDDGDGDRTGARVVAIMGPNGCGKSSYLRALAGLIPAGQNAEIHVNGRMLASTSVRGAGGSGVLYLFEDGERSLPPRSKVLNIFGSMARNLPRGGERLQHLDTILQDVMGCGLDDLRTRTVWELSGGERQVLSLAATSVLHDCPVLLLDEPVSRVDASKKARLACLMRSGALGHPRLFIVVSHEADFVHGCADRIYRLGEEEGANWVRLDRVGERWTSAHWGQSESRWLETVGSPAP